MNPPGEESQSKALSVPLIVVLASVLTLGPFAIDMYLASLPEISAQFGVSEVITQLTMTGYLVMLGLGQLVAGPISDSYGRRRPLLVGLVLFVLGSAFAGLAPAISWLVVGRIIQGAGGAIAFVVVNSVVRDVAEGQQATRIYSLLGVVIAFAPIAAPVIGGAIDKLFGWRAVFAGLATTGVIAFLVAFWLLPESLPKENRVALRLSPAFRSYGILLRITKVCLPLAGLSTAFLFLFLYLGGTSYIYQGYYGLDQIGFSLVFTLTSVSVLLGSVFANIAASTRSTGWIARVGMIIMFSGGTIAALATVVHLPIAALASGMALALLGLGIAEPSLMSLTMSGVEERVGSAAALMGAAQYLFGAVSAGIAGKLASLGPVAWASPMVVIALVGLFFTLMATRK